MSKNTYICNTCDKKYTRKSSLEKHSVLCAFLIKTEREKQIQKEEERDIPSYLQLVNIVQELSIKYNKLENELTEMQKWVEKKKKKINVISWLNTNMETTITFSDWVNSFSIHEEHFQFLMNNTIVDCFQNILEENLTTQKSKTETETVHPIKCFSQKNNLFYIYAIPIPIPIPNESIDCVCEWRQMSFDDFIYLLKVIQSKLLKALMLWKTKNKQYIEQTDSASILCNKTIIKLMEISFTKDTVFGKIKTNLYNYLKMDLKNLFEYEFEF
jgi:hypothetical protein